MVFDSSRGRVVMFGGLVGAGSLNFFNEATQNPNSETWEFDGVRWHFKSLDGPTPRAWHGMAYDPFETSLFCTAGIPKGRRAHSP